MELDKNTLVSMNFWGFTPKYFEQLESQFIKFIEDNNENIKSEFYIPSVVNQMILKGIGKTKVLESDAEWFGVTYQEDRPIVVESIRKLIREGKYPENLW